MDPQRGRSPSGGYQQPHINQSHSPSPQPRHDNLNSVDLGLGLEPGLPGSSNNQQYSNSNYSSGLNAFDNNGFLQSQQGQQYNQQSLQENFNPNQAFNQQSDFNQQFKQENLQQQGSPYVQQPTSFSQDLLDVNNFNGGDFSLYSTPGGQGDLIDPSFYMNESSQQAPSQSINPADLMSDMSSPQNHTPTPPQMLQPDTQQGSSAHQSPSFNQHQFSRSPGHSRHASLGPESAAFPNAHLPADWSMMQPQFTTHRRSPSEYSDVSVSSAAPSPNLGHHDAFDSVEQHHSPLVHPQDASLYQDALGIGNFSLSDPSIHGASPRRGMSPAHTPSISPRLDPQHQVPTIPQHQNFMLNMGISNNGFQQQPMIYNGQEQFPQLNRNGSVEMGQAQQMVPPEINVEFAPASRQNSFEPPKPSLDQDALTPPERGRFSKLFSLTSHTNIPQADDEEPFQIHIIMDQVSRVQQRHQVCLQVLVLILDLYLQTKHGLCPL